jgi:hypothetical protein
MGGVDHHGDASRREGRVDRVGDLDRHPLLDLKASGIDVDDAGELGDSDHSVARQVGDMRRPDDRGQVMLAVRHERDIAKEHHLIVSLDFLERAREQRHGVLLVTSEELFKARATRIGVSRRPSRLGSSPAQAIKVRTAASASGRVGWASVIARETIPSIVKPYS